MQSREEEKVDTLVPSETNHSKVGVLVSQEPIIKWASYPVKKETASPIRLSGQIVGVWRPVHFCKPSSGK